MNSEEFILIIRKVVRDQTIEDLIDNLKCPPGRKISVEEQTRSEWFNELPDEDRSNVEGLISDAVDEALFGFLSVLDGIRAIEHGDERGRLVLAYKNQDHELLNDPNKIGLHDLYNAMGGGI